MGGTKIVKFLTIFSLNCLTILTIYNCQNCQTIQNIQTIMNCQNIQIIVNCLTIQTSLNCLNILNILPALGWKKLEAMFPLETFSRNGIFWKLYQFLGAIGSFWKPLVKNGRIKTNIYSFFWELMQEKIGRNGKK